MHALCLWHHGRVQLNANNLIAVVLNQRHLLLKQAVLITVEVLHARVLQARADAHRHPRQLQYRDCWEVLWKSRLQRCHKAGGCIWPELRLSSAWHHHSAAAELIIFQLTASPVQGLVLALIRQGGPLLRDLDHIFGVECVCLILAEHRVLRHATMERECHCATHALGHAQSNDLDGRPHLPSW